MDIVQAIAEVRGQVARWRGAGERVGLVPTMGNLHDGHLSLVDGIRPHVDRVLVSIFVNPLQFGEGEDFETYPRTLQSDCAQLGSRAVDSVFAPETAEVYPDGMPLQTQVSVPALADTLCGLYRPGHFTGVATVVAKLFSLTQPDVAIFGKKDYQQLAIIRRMARDLNFPVEILGHDTVREADGLAKSSRNGYLSPAERATAPLLFQTLRSVAARLREGGRDFRTLESHAHDALRAAGFRPDYVSIRRRVDLALPDEGERELVVLAAAWLGRARLIDNIEVALSPAPGT